MEIRWRSLPNWPPPRAAKSSAMACRSWLRRAPPLTSAKARPRNSPSIASQADVDTVIFDDELSPAQSRNLETGLQLQGPRPHVAHPRHLRPARPHARRQAPDRAGATAAPAAAADAVLGPLVAAKGRHRHAQAAKVKRSWKPTAAGCRIASPAFRANWKSCAASAGPSATRASAIIGRWPRLSATPTRANPPCSMPSPARRCWRRTSSSPRSTRPRAACGCRRTRTCC